MPQLPPKPHTGSELAPVIRNHQLFSTLIQMAQEYQDGGFKTPRESAKKRVVFRGQNGSGSYKAKGLVQNLTTIVSSVTDNEAVKDLHTYKPVRTLEDPEWASKMDNLTILQRGVGDGQSVPIGAVTLVPATVTGVSATRRWAMIDPATPTELKAGASGRFKIEAWFDDGTNLCLLNTAVDQPLWKFRVRTDGSSSQCEIQDLDDQVFDNADVVPLIDASGWKVDDVMLCKNVGNKFYEIGGGGGGFNCDDLCDCTAFAVGSANFLRGSTSQPS